MLQSMRDRSQGFFTTLVIGLVCLTFVLWGVHAYLGGSGRQDVAAKVNGVVITTQQLNAAYERLRQQKQLELGADFVSDPALEKQLKQQALNQLITTLVLSKAASREGLNFSLSQAATLVRNAPTFKENGQFSEMRFRAMLESMFYTERGFLDDLRAAMMINQARVGIRNSAFALPAEVDRAIALIRQRRDVGYVVLPVKVFLNHAIPPETEINSYYQSHIRDFQIPAQASISYVLLKLSDLRASLHPTDAVLLAYYQANLPNYTLPERYRLAHILIQVPPDADKTRIHQLSERAQRLWNRVQQGESFSKLANQFSDDPDSRTAGGILPPHTAAELDGAVVEAIKQAGAKTGLMATPIYTRQGFEIIQIIGFEPARVLPFAKVKKQVRLAWMQQTAEHIFAEKSEQLGTLSFSQPDTLAGAAKTLRLSVKTTPLFSNGGSSDVPGITDQPNVVAIAFSEDVLAGNNSNVIAMGRDQALVLRINKHQPASVKTLDQVHAHIIGILQRAKAQEAVEAYAVSLMTEMNKGTTPQKMLHTYHLRWNRVNNVGRFDRQLNPQIVSYVFHTAPYVNAPHYDSAVLPNGDVAVVGVYRVTPGDVHALSEEDRAVFADQLARNMGQLDYQLYLRALFKKIRVES